MRRTMLLVLPVFVAFGCSSTKKLLRIEGDMPPMPSKPAPFAEMKMLEPMVGNWTGTGEMVEPDPETIRAMMPEAERANFKSTFAGGSKSEWAMGGAALKSEGWYEMPGDQKGNYLEYWTWDPRKGKFRTWFTSDWSESGGGWVTPSEDGRCFRMKGSATDAMCNKKKFEGCMCIVDNDTLEWHFTEKGPMGKFSMKGTSKRTK